VQFAYMHGNDSELHHGRVYRVNLHSNGVILLKRIKGRIIAKGVARGCRSYTSTALVLRRCRSQTRSHNRSTSRAARHSIAGTVLVFPQGKGSTVGSYVLYQLKRNEKAPAAIINAVSETIVAVGAIISNIPLIDKLEVDRSPQSSPDRMFS